MLSLDPKKVKKLFSKEEGIEVRIKDKTKYLGIYVHKDATTRHHVNYMTEKTERAVMSLLYEWLEENDTKKENRQNQNESRYNNKMKR